MKKYALLVLSCLFVFSSCSVNDSNPIPPQNIKYLWHLVKVTGGVSGVNETFSLETIVWTFTDDTKTLVVENNNTDDTLEDALDSGSYDFEVIQVGEKTFLNIDGTEFGNFEISQNNLVIDQNITTSGAGADGFVYSFQRTILVED